MELGKVEPALEFSAGKKEVSPPCKEEKPAEAESNRPQNQPSNFDFFFEPLSRPQP